MLISTKQLKVKKKKKEEEKPRMLFFIQYSYFIHLFVYFIYLFILSLENLDYVLDFRFNFRVQNTQQYAEI